MLDINYAITRLFGSRKSCPAWRQSRTLDACRMGRRCLLVARDLHEQLCKNVFASDLRYDPLRALARGWSARFLHDGRIELDTDRSSARTAWWRSVARTMCKQAVTAHLFDDRNPQTQRRRAPALTLPAYSRAWSTVTLSTVSTNRYRGPGIRRFMTSPDRRASYGRILCNPQPNVSPVDRSLRTQSRSPVTTNASSMSR